MLDDTAGQRAAIEDVRAALGDPLERVGEVRQHEPLARMQRPVLIGTAVHRVPLRRVAEQPVEDPVQVALRRRQLDALAGEARRRGDEVGPRHRPEPPVRRLQAERRARDGDRGRAGLEDLLRVPVEVDLEPQQLAGLGRRRRNRDEEVEQSRRSVATLVDEHEAAAAGPRQRALAHP